MNKIEQLIALLSGSLIGKQKKALLDELQKDAELSDMLDILKKMHELTPHNSKSTISAAKRLSKTLYSDFLKEQSSSEKQFPDGLLGSQIKVIFTLEDNMFL